MHQRLPILLFLFALLLRGLFCGSSELAFDEPFTIWFAKHDLRDMLDLARDENNPPLYFVLVHFWSKLVGPDVGWLRAPSVLFSALTLIPLYLIGERLGGQRVAVVASLLLIFSNYMTRFSHELRVYALFGLLAALAIWQLLRLIDGRPRAVLWSAIIHVLMVYAHFFGWLMIGVEFLVLVLVRQHHPHLRNWSLAILVAVIAYIPYLGIFLSRATSSIGEGTWLSPPRPEEFYNMLRRLSNAPVIAVGASAMLVAWAFITRLRSTAGRIALLWGVLPIFLMYLVSFVVPMFLDRYLIYAAPGFYLTLAIASIELLKARTMPWALAPAAMLIAGMALTFDPVMRSERRPSLVVAHAESERQGAPVIISPHWYGLTYAWHLDPAFFERPHELHDRLVERNIHVVHGPQDLPMDLITNSDRLVLVAPTSPSTPEATVHQSLLEAGFTAIHEAAPSKPVIVRTFERH